MAWIWSSPICLPHLLATRLVITVGRPGRLIATDCNFKNAPTAETRLKNCPRSRRFGVVAADPVGPISSERTGQRCACKAAERNSYVRGSLPVVARTRSALPRTCFPKCQARTHMHDCPMLELRDRRTPERTSRAIRKSSLVFLSYAMLLDYTLQGDLSFPKMKRCLLSGDLSKVSVRVAPTDRVLVFVFRNLGFRSL